MKTTPPHVLWIPLLLLAVLFSCKEEAPRSEDTPVFGKTFIDTHNGYSEAVVVVSGGLRTIMSPDR